MPGISALEIVTAYQDAWTQRDFQTAATYLADDVVFRSPTQHLHRVEQFLSMITAFAQRIQPGWTLIAATPSDDMVLLLYKLVLIGGQPAICADFFTVKEGLITSEILGFDPAPFR